MLDKKLQAKRNHHYVWADYLKRWSGGGNSVWYTTPKGKVSKDSVRGLAKERNFYEARYLTHEHLSAMRFFFSTSPSFLQEIHANYISDHLALQNVERSYRKIDLNDDELERLFLAWRCNAIEDLHSQHEREAKPILDALALGEFSVLEVDDSMIKFMAFLGQQFQRTNAVKLNFSKGARRARAQEKGDALLLSSLEDCWWIFSYLLGINLGWSLYVNRARDYHSLVVNESGMDFITSDQPVLNVNHRLCDESFQDIEDDACDLFFPISPRIAYMVSRSKFLPRGRVFISEDFVNEMNEKVSKNSESYIVGSSFESVGVYKDKVGNWSGVVKEYFS